jgi:hypothetical protein
VELTRKHVSKRALPASLPDAAASGSTHYRPAGASPPLAAPGLDDDARDRLHAIAAESETGSVLFRTGAALSLILPPFPFEAAADFGAIEPAPLLESLARPRTLAVMLLRLGGFSVGVFRGPVLVESKTGTRFVKNRHRKGGQSQRRFDRIREKQVHELFGKACEAAQQHLLPYEAEVQHVLFGGDRHTLHAFRKECRYFERFGERVLRRVLPVAGDPRKASLEAAPREIWASELYELRIA